ncbi:uncharacterized protein RCC_04555 [Ramularia collo-cygni]|uniref:Uncharacterized protein n=1 Tax=Ramularia collo-cygni TaxID=112498 RepID=A0A2D3URN2_9PEZI|nr:uncharacterized protein RCC_04555 [Ramularia collo-cygni]CZT18711.1 uncharacterized protein RCC_04555 [Ramularia collo-cygni]
MEPNQNAVVDGFQYANARLVAENESLKKANGQFGQRVVDMVLEKNDLKTEKGALKTEDGALKTENESLKAEIETLNTENASLKTEDDGHEACKRSFLRPIASQWHERR